jgi:hypothetical protein
LMAREQLCKLFDAPLPDDAVEAIEDLLKVTHLQGVADGKSKKYRKKATVVSA